MADIQCEGGIGKFGGVPVIDGGRNRRQIKETGNED